MNFKIIYIIGIILFFVGLIWMLLPHAYHALLIKEVNEGSSSHLIHTFEGFFIVLIGLGLIMYSQKKIKK